MPHPADNSSSRPHPDRRELAELSALADGTLEPDRQAEVYARIVASPELTALYRREQGVAALLRDARASTHAPDALRARIERSRPRTAVHVRRRAVYGAGLVGVMAAMALALVLVLPGGTPGGPSVSQAAALASRGPTAAAPLPDRTEPDVKLARAIDKTYFPNWSRSFGWSGTGERADRIEGRLAITVYYASKGRPIAYTIVSGPALAEPRASVSTRNGTAFRTFTLRDRAVITWRRSGHTCVLSGDRRIDPATLENLAAWKVAGLGRS